MINQQKKMNDLFCFGISCSHYLKQLDIILVNYWQNCVLNSQKFQFIDLCEIGYVIF